jgi:hypothetical protein
LRHDAALPGASPIQFALNIRFANRDPRRTAIDHHADSAAMRLAESRDAKELSEAVTH